MTAVDKVLLMVGAALVSLAVLFGLAAVFIPSFSADKTLVVGTILGALTTMATVIVGAYGVRGIGGTHEEHDRRERGDDGG